MKKDKHPIIRGGLILTTAGLTSKVIGFFYKIFLVSLIGAEGIGLYQMVFPLYILCVSLASSGIQTAISRFTAEKLSTEGYAKARQFFLTGLVLALSAASVLAFLLYLLAKPLSMLLGDVRCLPMLRLMAPAIPLETLHGCVGAWYLGQKKSVFPAISQLLEQASRTAAVFFLYRLLLSLDLAPTPLLAAGGLLIAELIAALVSLIAFLRPVPGIHAFQDLLTTLRAHKNSLALLLSVAAPLTVNRLFLNLLQSAEAILLPARLTAFYGNASQALSSYGIFSGMAMPLILFPCAITGSFSMVLLPSVSEAHALKNDKKIAQTIQSSLALCLFLGVICTAAFLLFGKEMGMLLFQESQAGSCLLVLAWLCPFLYLGSTLKSILHGIGKTLPVSVHSFAGISLRLLFIFFLVPYFGLSGFLWGVLASQITTVFLDIITLKHCISFSCSPAFFLYPALSCVPATLLLSGLRRIMPVLSLENNWISFLLSATIWGSAVLLPALPLCGRLLSHKTKHSYAQEL